MLIKFYCFGGGGGGLAAAGGGLELEIEAETSLRGLSFGLTSS